MNMGGFAFTCVWFSEVELDLHLKNTSPAVLDSKIIFTAELDVTPHGDVRAAIYKYGKCLPVICHCV